MKHTTALQPPTWQIAYDVLTGRVNFNLHVETNYRVDDTTVNYCTYHESCQVEPRDPAHASARGLYSLRIVRPNQAVQGNSDLLIQATATHFHITIDLEVRVNDAPHFARRWVESVPRYLL